MSVLGKRPFIEALLSSLSEEELERFASLINTKGQPTNLRLEPGFGDSLPASAPATVAERIKPVNLIVGSNSIYTGILVYGDTYCAFIGTIAFREDIIKLLKIDVASRKVIPMDEKLTADELRRVLDDAINGSGGSVLPDTSEASAGDVLTLDSDKELSWAAPENELPNTSGASAGDVLTLDANKEPAWVAPSSGGSETHDVYVSTDRGATWSETPISLEEWIANCEAGNVYTADGIWVKITNLLGRESVRLRLISHDSIYMYFNYPSARSKTTWQFVDMVSKYTLIGLPLNLLATANGGLAASTLNSFLTGTLSSDVTLYASCAAGYGNAVCMHQNNEALFQSLPDILQKHIKTSNRSCPMVDGIVYKTDGTATLHTTTQAMPMKIFDLTNNELYNSSYLTNSHIKGASDRICYAYDGTVATGYLLASSSDLGNGQYKWIAQSSNGITTDYVDSYHNGYYQAQAFCI